LAISRDGCLLRRFEYRAILRVRRASPAELVEAITCRSLRLQSFSAKACPFLAMLTCLATVVVAGIMGAVVASLAGHSYMEKKRYQVKA